MNMQVDYSKAGYGKLSENLKSKYVKNREYLILLLKIQYCFFRFHF